MLTQQWRKSTAVFTGGQAGQLLVRRLPGWKLLPAFLAGTQPRAVFPAHTAGTKWAQLHD